MNIFATAVQKHLSSYQMSSKTNWDGLGIATSLACAIHCAILPLIATSFPLFGINIIHNSIFEWGMIALAFGIGAYALSHGFSKHHRSFFPLVLFTAGFLFLIAKQCFHSYERILLIPAVLLIVSSHYYNYRLCNRRKCHTADHVH